MKTNHRTEKKNSLRLWWFYSQFFFQFFLLNSPSTLRGLGVSVMRTAWASTDYRSFDCGEGGAWPIGKYTFLLNLAWEMNDENSASLFVDSEFSSEIGSKYSQSSDWEMAKYFKFLRCVWKNLTLVAVRHVPDIARPLDIIIRVSRVFALWSSASICFVFG